MYFSERHIFTVGGPLAEGNELALPDLRKRKQTKKPACELSELSQKQNSLSDGGTASTC